MLSIDLIKPKNDFKHPTVKYPKVLPQHEFSMLIVAPKGSGKTNFICNLLLKQYKGYFNRVLVCSPTVDNDPKWDVVKDTKGVLAENKELKKIRENMPTNQKHKLPSLVKAPGKKESDDPENEKFQGYIPEEDFFINLDELPPKLRKQNDVIQSLRDEHGDKAKFIADRMLVILDDQAGMFKGGNTNNPMVNFVLRHRHYSSSVIIVTQAYKAIPKSIRTNCNALIAFEIANLGELKVVYEEWPESMREEEWMKVFDFCTREPFTFIYINNHFPKGQRIFKNFTHKIIDRHIQDGEDKGGD
jgi:hypothetical protein